MNGEENPFCARRIRPGAVPFLFAPGHCVEQLVEKLKQAKWWGQIVGPHGSGKSALLAALVPAIERAGRKVLSIELHNGQRRLPAGVLDAIGPPGGSLLAVDGYEQLGPWHRMELKRSCRRQRHGLLVTSHRPAGLPDLYRPTVEIALAWRVVEQLQEGHRALVSQRDVAALLKKHSGDLRETLFALYDLYAEQAAIT
jgi:hypothetical protein